MNTQFVINLVLGIIGLSMIAYIVPTPKLKYPFLIAYSCLIFYRLYDPTTGGPGTDWMRHIVISFGEVAFFIFITNFCKRYIERENDSNNLITATDSATSLSAQPVFARSESSTLESASQTETEDKDANKPSSSYGLIGIPFVSIGAIKSTGVSILAFGSFASIYGYGSEQGISHIFLAPVFLAIIAIVFNRISVYSSPFKGIAKLFLLAYALGVMLHVGEFFLESHPLVTLTKDNQHNMEMFFYVLSSFVFFYTLIKFNTLLKRDNGLRKTV